MKEYNILKQIGEKALEIGQKEGAEEVEVFVTKKNLSSLSTSFEQRAIKSTESQDDSIIGLAITLRMKDNHIGYTYSSDFETESLKEVIHGAAKVAVLRADFPGFVTKGDITDVPKLYDPKVQEFLNDPEMLKNIIVRASNQVSTFNDVYLRYATITAVDIDTVIMNSNDVCLSRSGSFFAYSNNTVHQSKETHSQTYRHFVRRNLDEFTIEDIVTETAEESKIMNNILKIEETTCPAILTARAASDLYGYQFDPTVGLHGVAAGFSRFSDKLGEEVASTKLTLYDDATLPGGQYSNSFDDEGSPTKKTIIIEKGILKNFLSNLSFAARNKTETTSSAARRAFRRINNYYTREYIYRPSICPSNFCITPGNSSDEELLTEMKDGLLINVISGGITIVELGGDFNVQGMHIFKVDKGEIVGGINETSIKGNWYQIFKDIQLVGSKPDREMSSLGSTSFIWPKLLIRELKFKPM